MTSKYPGIETLRQRLLDARHEICIERARYLTESYRRTEGEPQPIRFARALAHVLASIPIIIRDLAVRIAGFSVLFTRLSKKAQDEIIGRSISTL